MEICTRSYNILTQKCGIPAEDIIFDPNILTIATGIGKYRLSDDIGIAIEYNTWSSHLLLPLYVYIYIYILYRYRGTQPICNQLY